MDVAYAYPELRFIDDKPSLVPIPTGTSSVFASYWPDLSGQTEAEVQPLLVSREIRSPFEQLIDRAGADFSSAFLFITRRRTSTVSQDYEMALLEAASSISNGKAFAEIVNKIAWEYRPVEDFLKAVRLALSVGAHLQARKLAIEGGLRFTGNAEMQKYARILAPTKVLDAHLPPDPGAAADMQWLKIHRDEYRGWWVALRNGVLLASAKSRKELLVKLEDLKDKSVLITPVY